MNQVHGEYEVRHKDLISYYKVVSKMAEEFMNFFNGYLPSQQNARGDAIASHTVSLALFVGASKKVLVFILDLYCPKLLIEEEGTSTEVFQDEEALATLICPEQRDWYFYLYMILTDDPHETTTIKRKAPQVQYNAMSRTLYCQSHDGVLLQCFSPQEAK